MSLLSRAAFVPIELLLALITGADWLLGVTWPVIDGSCSIEPLLNFEQMLVISDAPNRSSSPGG
jgi:hypothetical protein